MIQPTNFKFNRPDNLIWIVCGHDIATSVDIMVLYEIFHILTGETQNTIFSGLRKLFVIVEGKLEFGSFPMIIEIFVLNDIMNICKIVIWLVTKN